MEIEKQLYERKKELDCLYLLADILSRRIESVPVLLDQVRKELTKSMQYSESAEIFIGFDNFTSGIYPEYEKSVLHRFEETLDDGTVLTLIIWYKDKSLAFMEREIFLIKSALSILANSISRKHSEYIEISQRKSLEEKNITLREIMDRIGEDKKDVVKQIQFNIDANILPLINLLKETSLDDNQNHILTIMEKKLSDILTPFDLQLKKLSSVITPRELEICCLIKSGNSSKNIADMLNISIETVERHRCSIRKKLGLNRSSTNLTSYLRTF